MARLAQTDGLTDIQQDMLSAVRTFVDKEVLPVATGYEHRDEFPAELVDQMKDMGLFGITIDEKYGGLGESLLTYALVVEEMARGWMSLAGVLNTHFIVAYLVSRHGTDAQRERLLPRMATGELRAAFSLSEPGCGSDVAAIGTKAVRDGDDYVVNGQKMWLTNGLRAGLVATLVKTDEGADSVYRNMTTLLVEKEPGASEHGGITIPRQLEKMGYKGVETTELVFTDHRVPAGMALGERPGAGFSQMMDGLEVGRVNVAARACGIAIRAFELAIGYAQQRQAFGHPIVDHQAVAFKLAEMATKVEAAHLMMVRAARLKDAGERNDLEAGMAKLLASEYCVEVTTDAFRIHGGYGYSKEFEIERLYREAPFLLIGEGTSEIQKRVISRQLLKDYRQ
jgi:alkylation response protein AidB-like acyl-CoA dehydrogenase